MQIFHSTIYFCIIKLKFMGNGLVLVKFRNGKIRELSSHIAYDIQHQKTLGFTPLDGEAQAVIVEPKKKIEQESPVVDKSDIRENEEVPTQVETQSLPIVEEVLEVIKKKRGPKPKTTT